MIAKIDRRETASSAIVEIRTKYYTANLSLVPIPIGDDSEDSTTGDSQELVQSNMESAEGIIVIIRINTVSEEVSIQCQSLELIELMSSVRI